MVEPVETTGGSRWMKIALAVSVALNLAVAGIAAGAWLKEGRHRGLPRDLSFGQFGEAFSSEDRRALREAFVERGAGFREARQAARAELDALVAALRADPFDPAAMTAVLSAIETRYVDRLKLGRSLIEARILQMTDPERQAFAERFAKGRRPERGG